MISTCLSAGEDPAEYYSWVLGTDADTIAVNPKNYTPFAFAILRAEETKLQEAGSHESHAMLQTNLPESPQKFLH